MKIVRKKTPPKTQMLERIAQQLARREKASNRIQNNSDKIILEMKRSERKRRKT